MAIGNATEIVAFVERLIDDEGNEHHSDSEIYDALKRYRWEARYLKLDALVTKASGGTTSYTVFVPPSDNWRYFESDTISYDYNYDSLAASESSVDYIEGRWEFSSAPTRPVYVLGWSHDPYAAAADLLEVRGSQLGESFQSFQSLTGNFSFGREKRAGPLELADKYRAMSRNASHMRRIERVDLNPFDG